MIVVLGIVLALLIVGFRARHARNREERAGARGAPKPTPVVEHDPTVIRVAAARWFRGHGGAM